MPDGFAPPIGKLAQGPPNTVAPAGGKGLSLEATGKLPKGLLQDGDVTSAAILDATIAVADISQTAINNLLPWLIDIDVFMSAVAQTNWDNLDSNQPTYTYNARKSSSGAQNDEINFDVVLAAGTWTFELLHTAYTNRGIYSVQFDGVEAGTIDGYAAAEVLNIRSYLTGITISPTQKYRLKLKMATKNASSSSYYGYIQHAQLRRTS